MGHFSELLKFDTPTICNALEAVDPRRKDFGYTTKLFHVVNGDASPVIGYARTATIRSLNPSCMTPQQIKAHRIEYYRYVASGSSPRILVMQDIDGEDAGRGPFWGEFNTRIHRSLDVAGVVTNGSVRDLRQLPSEPLILSSGPRPSHANIHVVDFGQSVNVYGMYTGHDFIVHADEHGAVTFDGTLMGQVLEAANEFVESERPLIEACKREKLSVERIAELYIGRSVIPPVRSDGS